MTGRFDQGVITWRSGRRSKPTTIHQPIPATPDEALGPSEASLDLSEGAVCGCLVAQLCSELIVCITVKMHSSHDILQSGIDKTSVVALNGHIVRGLLQLY